MTLPQDLQKRIDDVEALNFKKVVWALILLVLCLPLGMRLMLLYIYSVLGVQPYFVDYIDLPLLAGLVALTLALLYRKARPNRRETVLILIVGTILAGISAFVTLMIYSLVLGMLTG